MADEIEVAVYPADSVPPPKTKTRIALSQVGRQGIDVVTLKEDGSLGYHIGQLIVGKGFHLFRDLPADFPFPSTDDGRIEVFS